MVGSIPAPGAEDAAGKRVPVSMSVSGDVLTLTVDDRTGEFKWPIAVDPEFDLDTDSTISTKTWEFKSATGGFVGGSCCGELWITGSGAVSGDIGELWYRTNGDSKIYDVKTQVEVPEIATPTATLMEKAMCTWNMKAPGLKKII